MKIILLILALGFPTFCFGQINKSLRNELLEILKTDQERPISPSDSDFIQKWQRQNKIDSLNMIRVATILDSIGFPSKSLVGNKAYIATFLVVQHSTLKYQEKYLPIFQKAAEQNELAWSNVAMMIDRVKVNKNEKQIYGTQVHCIKDPISGYCTDKAEFDPIEDEINVNIRRNKVGLNTIEDYAKSFGIEYVQKK